MDKLTQERLERTEASLRLAGCEKCNVCKVFMDREEIKDGICGECK